MLALSDVLLADEILVHQHGRHTGLLAVRSGEVTKALCFQAGRIVFASSTSAEDKLGEQLVRLGRISRAEFAEAFQRASVSGTRLGKALVGAGVLTDEEIGQLVAHQVQKIALSMFTWTSGEIEFHFVDHPAPPDLTVDLSTQRLIFEGARIYPDVARLEQALGDPARRLRAVVPAPFDVRKVGLTPVERAVLTQARDGARIGEVLGRPEPRPVLVWALYAVLAAGLVEPDDRPAEHSYPFETETGTFRVASPAATATPSEDRTDRILRVFESLRRATHYEMLELSSDAPPEAVHVAHARLAQELAADERAVMGDVRLDSALEAIKERRREAFETLSDQRRRAAYDRSLSGHAHSHAPSRRDTAEAHARAARLTREARDLLQQGERDAAIALLVEAVDADPRERTARRQLALVLAEHPTLSRQAERHFLTALDLDPRDLDLRCRLAHYYRRGNMLVRARLHAEAVLRLDPHNEPAQLELEAIQALERRNKL